MKRTNPRRGASQHLLRTTPVAAAAAAVLCTSAWAQQAPDAPAQTVTVTGIRRGIESAINVKKKSDSIVEAVSAEDIGKLPDTSIAESIARLPGLSAQRVAGRAQVISVRGLSPDFATTLLNGRELVSTGDNRSVEFDQYPSELLSGVTIFKTPDAALVGQGLSGTLDMQTVRPLNFGSRTIAVGGRFERNSLGAAANAKATGNRFSVSYIDQFANRTVGVVLGYSHLETPVLEQQVGLYEPWKNDARPGLPAGTFASDGIKSLVRTGVNKRDGVMAAIEWRPSKEWTSTLDLFTSKFTKTDTANQFEVNLGDYNGGFTPGLNYTSTTVNSNGTLTGGVATGVYPLVRGMYNDRTDKINAVGLNNRFKLGGVSVLADVSWSKAKRDELNLENNTQLTPVPSLDTLTLNYDTGGFPTLTPGRDYSDPSRLFLRGTIYGSGYGKVPHIDDELKGFKVAATVPVPESFTAAIPDIEIGLNYADRQKNKTQPEGNINVGAQGDTTIASDLQYGLVDLGFSGTGKIPSWNVPGAVARYMTFEPDDEASYLISKAWQVQEKITTVYAKANLDTRWGSVPVRGNFGVQIQAVDQSSNSRYYDGTAPDGSRVKPINDGKTYTDVLPNLNLAFDLGGDQTLRLGLAKQVARPRVDQLRSALDFGVDTATGRPGASGGNPKIDPWRATALDLSYEKYFGTRAYFAVAGFYKDLKTYIYTQSRDFDFSAFVAGYVPQPGQPPAQSIGTLTAPFNGNGGKLSGLELSASYPLGMLTPALQGFGLVLSTSVTDSNIKVRDPDSASSVGSGDISLPGLSKTVTNLTAYYENGGFEARISQRKRSDFIGEIGNFAGARTLRYVVGESIVDMQVGYNFNEGAFKGLGLLLQVNNVGNEAYKTYAGTKDRPLETIKWGRSVLLGANYKF
jgi:iron complex outermembrane recepter protein